MNEPYSQALEPTSNDHPSRGSVAFEEGRSPLDVHLYVTPLCNLHCIHCYYDAKRLGEPTGELLSTTDLALIVQVLTKRYNADIHMEGGEVFLRPDLEAVMDLVPDPCWGAVTVTTGGVAHIALSADRLKKFGDVRVSVEGHTEAAQRMIRGVGLERILATCERLRSDDVAVTMRITLHRMNADRVPEMLHFFLDRGCTRFSLFEMQPVGRGRALDGLFLRESDVERVLNDLASAPPDPRMRSLKINLPSGRAPLVDGRGEGLVRRGYEIRHAAGSPSLTINSDGAMGVSAWSITANAVSDQIATFDRQNLAGQLEALMRRGVLTRPCPFTSGVSIRYRPGDGPP